MLKLARLFDFLNRLECVEYFIHLSAEFMEGVQHPGVEIAGIDPVIAPGDDLHGTFVLNAGL